MHLPFCPYEVFRRNAQPPRQGRLFGVWGDPDKQFLNNFPQGKGSKLQSGLHFALLAKLILSSNQVMLIRKNILFEFCNKRCLSSIFAKIMHDRISTI